MIKLEKIQKIKDKRFLFKVEISENPEDYKKYEELRYEVWGDPEDNLPGKRNMNNENFFNLGSCLFIGVYCEDENCRLREDPTHFIGFSYGFVTVKDKEVAFRRADNIIFYSLYTAVKKDFRNYGLGILIKEFQREIVLEVFGIQAITCTYDPLTGTNAYRNIHHFGMEVLEYKKALYKDFAGNLNRLDIPCDRFYVFWDLKKKAEKPNYDLDFLIKSENLAVSSDVIDIKGRTRPLALEVVKKINLGLDNDFLLIEIPYDFYLMLQETVVPQKEIRNIPLQWRMATRKAFETYLKRGYKIVDFRWYIIGDRKRDFYVLKKKLS